MLTKTELKKYSALIDDYVKPNIFIGFHQSGGVFKHPFIDASAQYEGMLWDWDNFFFIRSLFLALNRYKNDVGFDYAATKEKVLSHAKGSIYNFFDAQEDDGFIPVMLTSSGPFSTFYHETHKRGEKHNQHKPFLLQNILQISEFCNDYDWFDVEKALKYLSYYENNQYDAFSGLFYWIDDIMIGIDNNPTVYHRNKESSGDIFLNSFIKKEYDAAVALLTAKKDARATEYMAKAQKLSDNINKLCYDEKDKIYYSQDLSFNHTPTYVGDFLMHEGMSFTWNTLPMKIRFWGCFAPIYAKIADDKRAKEIAKTHFKDPAVMAEYGIRSVASDERTYFLGKTSNPSNWLGPIWVNANWVIYKGLKDYKIEIYKEIAEKIVRLLGENIEKNGAMYESYLPDNGEPCLYPNFTNWNLLVIEMLDDLEKM